MIPIFADTFHLLFELPGANLRRFIDLVLPESQVTPAYCSVQLCCFAIHLNVAPEFLLPETTVVFWHNTIFWTIVPKTAIDKDSHHGPDKYQIRSRLADPYVQR